MIRPSRTSEVSVGAVHKDFVRKNLTTWSLRPTPEFSPVDATRPQIAERNVALVTVSRVGFNVWHTRKLVTWPVNIT